MATKTAIKDPLAHWCCKKDCDIILKDEVFD